MLAGPTRLRHPWHFLGGPYSTAPARSGPRPTLPDTSLPTHAHSGPCSGLPDRLRSCPSPPGPDRPDQTDPPADPTRTYPVASNLARSCELLARPAPGESYSTLIGPSRSPKTLPDPAGPWPARSGRRPERPWPPVRSWRVRFRKIRSHRILPDPVRYRPIRSGRRPASPTRSYQTA